jgi:hypothetical protein
LGKDEGKSKKDELGQKDGGRKSGAGSLMLDGLELLKARLKAEVDGSLSDISGKVVEDFGTNCSVSSVFLHDLR